MFRFGKTSKSINSFTIHDMTRWKKRSRTKEYLVAGNASVKENFRGANLI